MASRINTNKHGDPQQQVFSFSSSKDSGHLPSLPRNLWLGSRMLAELDKKDQWWTWPSTREESIASHPCVRRWSASVGIIILCSIVSPVRRKKHAGRLLVA